MGLLPTRVELAEGLLSTGLPHLVSMSGTKKYLFKAVLAESFLLAIINNGFPLSSPMAPVRRITNLQPAHPAGERTDGVLTNSSDSWMTVPAKSSLRSRNTVPA